MVLGTWCKHCAQISLPVCTKWLFQKLCASRFKAVTPTNVPHSWLLKEKNKLRQSFVHPTPEKNNLSTPKEQLVKNYRRRYPQLKANDYLFPIVEIDNTICLIITSADDVYSVFSVSQESASISCLQKLCEANITTHGSEVRYRTTESLGNRLNHP